MSQSRMRSVRVRGSSELGTGTNDSFDEIKVSLPTNLRTQIKLLLEGLRRRQLVGPLPCAMATLKVLRTLVANCKCSSTEQLMKLTRTVGRELASAAPAEMVIGNIVKRVLFMIREEYSAKMRALEIQAKKSETSLESLGKPANIAASFSDMSLNSVTSSQGGDASGIGGAPDTADREEQGQQQQQQQHLDNDNDIDDTFVIGEDLTMDGSQTNTAPAGSLSPPYKLKSSNRRSATSSPHIGELMPGREQSHMDLSDLMSNQPSLQGLISRARDSETDFSKIFPDFKQNVIGAINEFLDELDSMFELDGPICEQAVDHIHADECILVYGYSNSVDLFLRAAARERKFQVVIVESDPSLSGINLANSLSGLPNVSITLIPDSVIYAIMARINKVLFSPLAVMADGGALCNNGLLMVAVAAKEYSVPVVGVTGSLCITPLFTHNQGNTLGQLISPSSMIPYNAPVNFENVEVFVPAFDSLSPELINLYVTNSGSHVPSYIYRLLSEMYHPDDYSL